MSKHTPGPWLAQGRYIGVKGHMSYIGECGDQNGNWTNEPMAVANARLIAAAPDLLEACKALLAITDSFNLHGPATGDARAAIAEGEMK